MRTLLAVVAITILSAGCARDTMPKNGADGPGMGNPASAANPQPPKSAVEGTVNGGGGKGILCVKAGATSIETLDLYESKAIYRSNVVTIGQTESDALDAGATLVANHFWVPDQGTTLKFKSSIKNMLSDMLNKQIRFIGANQSLKLIADSHEPIVESGCDAVQVAVYYDESIILVDKSLWDQMDWTNRMGLLVHELVYSMDRHSGAKDSIATRKLVGQLFSSSGTVPKAKNLPRDSSKYLRCTLSKQNVLFGHLYAFDSVKDGKKGIELLFNFMTNQNDLFHKSAFLNYDSLETLLSGVQVGSGESDIQIGDYPVTDEIRVKFSGKGNAVVSLFDQKSGNLTEGYELRCSQNE